MRRPSSASPGIRLYYRISYQDAQGRTYRKGRRRVSHSYLKQFIQLQRCFLRGATETGVLDTSNTSRTLAVSSTFSNTVSLLGPAGTASYGSVVGTGSTAVAITDYALGTQIAHGVAATQMEYALTAISSAAVAGSVASITVTRTFTNSSGNVITVTEIGLYCNFMDSIGTRRPFCIARDIVTATAIPHSESRTVEYKISVTA